MVVFCPKCGSIMVPVRKEGAVYLKCSKCGYEAKSEGSRRYDVKHQVESSKRVLTAATSEARDTKLSPEDREMLREYYEIFLEEFERSEVEEQEAE